MLKVDGKTYSLEDYTSMLKYSLLTVIADVENSFYFFQQNKQKKDWDPDAMASFLKIRHKLLDSANAIERIPAGL